MTWHELLDQAIRDYGDTPGATLEQHLIDTYAEHPAAVQVAIHKITQAFKAGKISSPWGAVKAEVARQITVRHNMPANTDRHAKERNAEQWIRTCGLHFDRYDELHDELFGDRGPLRHWADDTTLETRLRKLWDEVRPAGQQLEDADAERAERWIAHRATTPAKAEAT